MGRPVRFIDTAGTAEANEDPGRGVLRPAPHGAGHRGRGCGAPGRGRHAGAHGRGHAHRGGRDRRPGGGWSSALNKWDLIDPTSGTHLLQVPQAGAPAVPGHAGAADLGADRARGSAASCPALLDGPRGPDPGVAHGRGEPGARALRGRHPPPRGVGRDPVRHAGGHRPADVRDVRDRRPRRRVHAGTWRTRSAATSASTGPGPDLLPAQAPPRGTGDARRR